MNIDTEGSEVNIGKIIDVEATILNLIKRVEDLEKNYA